MKYVFGPVFSRRLGMSLGIDTIPLKTCNWNCVYCQLGRTTPLTNKRLEYFPRHEILGEVKSVLNLQNPVKTDWITFVGSGEPTLHIDLGWLIREVKVLTNIPVAVITNGSLLYLPEVRHELAPADAVLPTLDIGNPRLYKKINRPHPEVSFDRLIDGLTIFRKEYRGRFWLEVMLVHGLNDTQQALKEIAARIDQIRPDEVHINIPDRPPAENWVEPPDEEGLLRAQAILGKTARVVHSATGNFNLENCDTLKYAIIGIVTRHPMREYDLMQTIGNWSQIEFHEELEKLIVSGEVQIIERYGCRFYSSRSAHYQRNQERTQ